NVVEVDAAFERVRERRDERVAAEIHERRQEPGVRILELARERNLRRDLIGLAVLEELGAEVDDGLPGLPERSLGVLVDAEELGVPEDRPHIALEAALGGCELGI